MPNEYKIHKNVMQNPKNILCGDGKTIVQVSEEIAKQTSGKGGVTTTQIRKIFGDLKRHQYQKFDEKSLNKIYLIRPKLAYTFARHSRYKGIDLLLGTIDFLLSKVESKEDFNNVVSFFEAILAYHKKHGGK